MIDTKRENIHCKGIGVSPGIAIGKVFLFSSEQIDVPVTYGLDAQERGNEVRRFLQSLDMSRSQLSRIREEILEGRGKGRQHVQIIDAHIMMLDDSMLRKDTIKIINSEGVNAEFALDRVLQGIKQFFGNIEDEYMRERGSDIDYIGNRILSNLMQRKRDKIADMKGNIIIVAKDLSPTDTLQMPDSGVKGFMTELGGRMSHTAVFSRSLEIPAVIGIGNITQLVKSGDIIILDGETGDVIINPGKDECREYAISQDRFSSYEKELRQYDHLTSETLDGQRIHLLGNIEFPEEATLLMEHGADGIGLFRTEFIYLNREKLPDEDDHFRAYRRVIDLVGDKPVTIRTLDIGGDKFSRFVRVDNELNPALGLRAVRFCMKNPDLFRIQLKGILRAGAFGNVRILFPMISGVEELRGVKSILDQAKEDLEREGREFDNAMETGIMIEVPSAALIADILAREVDFFSIGTNDLMQYCLAFDRGNEHVDYLYDPLHPAIMRIIGTIVKAANDAGIGICLCGEMAGEPRYTPMLLALGLDELSMNSFSLPRVKKVVRGMNYSGLSGLADELFAGRPSFGDRLNKMLKN